MNLVPSGIELPFEVTYDDPALFVAMKVYDMTSGSPVLVAGPLAMSNIVGNTYAGKFMPLDDKPYLIHKAVYTDGTYTTLDPDHSQASETIIGIDLSIIPELSSDTIPDLVGELEDEDGALTDC